MFEFWGMWPCNSPCFPLGVWVYNSDLDPTSISAQAEFAFVLFILLLCVLGPICVVSLS